jgi:hypothetical protein
MSRARELRKRKRRIDRRLQERTWPAQKRPMFRAARIHYEIAERTRAMACGGLGAIHMLAREVGLVDGIDRRLHLLKIHLPYHESDHGMTREADTIQRVKVPTWQEPEPRSGGGVPKAKAPVRSLLTNPAWGWGAILRAPTGDGSATAPIDPVLPKSWDPGAGAGQPDGSGEAAGRSAFSAARVLAGRVRDRQRLCA